MLIFYNHIHCHDNQVNLNPWTLYPTLITLLLSLYILLTTHKHLSFPPSPSPSLPPQINARIFQSLHDESRRFHDYHKASYPLTQQQQQQQAVDTPTTSSSRPNLEVAELQRVNAQLHGELARERSRLEARTSQLEEEAESLKERLQDGRDKLAVAEDNLMVAQQHFEASLGELRSKAELLSAALDKEVGLRKGAEEESVVLKQSAESVREELREMVRKASSREQELGVALEEAKTAKTAIELELAVAKETSQQLVSQVSMAEQTVVSTGKEVGLGRREGGAMQSC